MDLLREISNFQSSNISYVSDSYNLRNCYRFDHFPITGEYRVQLPDGRVQIVSYTASAEKGYVANVRYEGKAVYPDNPPKKHTSKKHKRKVKNPKMKFHEMKKRYPQYYKDATYPSEYSRNLRFEE